MMLFRNRGPVDDEAWYPAPLAGFEIIKSESLAGMNKAVKQGRKVYVSPAVWSLLQGASTKELERLLNNLPFVDIPEMPSPAEMSQQLFTEIGR